mmetsp:Transcript_16841/g.68818  ORF Transcript_16841/g.68818 Transcript_16841/m.68818 type:complete len:456 (-) Transcript_16841:807-2174(-)
MDLMGHCSTISRLRSLEMDPLVSRRAPHPLRSRLLELKSPDEFTRTFRANESLATPPIATAFSTQALGGCLLGIADEEGQVTLLDSRKKFGNLDSADSSGLDGKYAHTYEVHRNAIFDFMWLYDDLSFATVSGDGSAKITAVRDGETLGTLVGHSGSVKTIRSKPMNPHTLSTAGRDGNIMIWDLRVHQERVLKPVVRVQGAHAIYGNDPAKRKQRSVNPPSASSVTALAFLNEETLLSGGAADGRVLAWDLRNISSGHVFELNPRGDGNTDSFGVSSLDIDPCSRRVLAGTTDSKIHIFSTTSLDEGTQRTLGGHMSRSFYVKATFDPTGDMVLSGSEDSRAYVWDLSLPSKQNAVEQNYLTLEGHYGGEVSDVSWCRTDCTTIATACDDCTVRVWKADQEEPCRASALLNQRASQEGMEVDTPSVPPRGCHQRQTTITSFFSPARDNRVIQVK